MFNPNALPEIGVGVGYRRQFGNAIFESKGEIDWLEIISENYMDIGGKAALALSEALEHFPVLPHGVNLSIGSIDPLNIRYLELLRKLIEKTGCPWASDHLCFTSCGGRYTQQLLPLPRTRETVFRVVRRVKEVQAMLGVPLLLENITYYITFPESTMTESEFLSEVCERADCGILLDINNVVVNAKNFSLDEFSFIDEIDPARVVQVHLAGHKIGKNLVLDTHGEAVSESVYNLFEYALKRVKPKAVLLERDDNFSDFGEIILELRKIRSYCDKFELFQKPVNYSLSVG